MKKIITIVLIIMLTSMLLLTSALGAPDDPATVDATASPESTQTPTAEVSDGQALLSKVVVSSVYQSTKNPNNTMNVAVDLKNLNTKAMHDVLVSVDGLSSSTVSLTKTFGPFRTDLGAGGTGSINFTLYAPQTVLGGNFPITLILTYVDDSGKTVNLSRGISILIDRGTGLTGSQASVLSAPRIYVGSYSIGADKVFGGDEFELTYTLVNSSPTTVKNILLTLDADSNAYTAKTGVSNQVYIGEIAGSGSYTGKIILSANSALKSGTYSIVFSLQYESVSNTSYTSTALISIPMDQEQVLSIGSIKLPETGVVNSKALLNVSYENPGTTDIKNLVMLLSGDIPDNEKTVSIGTVKAGSSGNADQYITSLDTGPQEIKVSFTFEDSAGNAYTTATRSVTMDVQAAAAAASNDGNPVSTTDNGTQTATTPSLNLNSLWIYFVIGGVVLVAAAVVFIVVYVKKKKTPKWSESTR